MSKMDGLRAMRAERYERLQAQPSKAAAARRASGGEEAPVAPPVRKDPATTADPPGPTRVEEPVGRLCGHKAISGRTCTREHGHAAKSHRYS